MTPVKLCPVHGYAVPQLVYESSTSRFSRQRFDFPDLLSFLELLCCFATLSVYGHFSLLVNSRTEGGYCKSRAKVHS